MPKGKNPGPATDVAIALVGSAAAAGIAAASIGVAPAVGVALAAGGTAGNALLAYATTRLAERRERRWGRWIEAYIRADPSVDEAEVEAHLHAKGDDPLVQEVVLEGVRAIDEALVDIVVPALARLTRQYVTTGRQADGFFRGVRRTLTDLTSEEYAALLGLLQRLEALDVATSQPDVHLHYRATAEQPIPQLHYMRPYSEEERKRRSTFNEAVPMGQLDHFLRLFHLLKTNGLGRDSSTSGKFGGASGPHVIVVPFSM